MNRRAKLFACFLLFLLAASSLPGRGLSGTPVSSRLERPLRFPVERDFGGVPAKVLKLRADLPDFMPLRFSSGLLQAVRGFFDAGKRILLLRDGASLASGWAGYEGLSLPVSSSVGSEDVLEVVELPWDSSAVNLTKNPGSDVVSSICPDGSGGFWVAWQRGLQVLLARFGPGGDNLSGEISLGNASSGVPYPASVASLGSSARVVWVDSGQVLWMRDYCPDGAPAGPAQSLGSGVVRRVSCACSGDHFHVLWARRGGETPLYSWGSLPASGGALEKYDSPYSDYRGRPVILPAPGGDAYVVMVPGYSGRLFAARVAPDGKPRWSTSLNLFWHGSALPDYESSAAVSPDGSLWVFFRRGDGVLSGLWLWKLSPEGRTLLARPALLSSAAEPAVACDSAGRVFLAWVRDLSSEGLGKEVFSWVLSPDGTPLTEPRNESGAAGADFSPILASSGSSVILAWNSTRDGNSEVYARLLAPPERRPGAPSDLVRVTELRRPATLKSLSVSPDGTVWAVWQHTWPGGTCGFLRVVGPDGSLLTDEVPYWAGVDPMYPVHISPGGIVADVAGALAVFHKWESGDQQYRIRRYIRSGFWTGDDAVIPHSRYGMTPPLALLHGGNLWAVYTITSGSSVDIYYPWVYVAAEGDLGGGTCSQIGYEYSLSALAACPGPGEDIYIAYGGGGAWMPDYGYLVRVRPDGRLAWKKELPLRKPWGVAVASFGGDVFVAYAAPPNLYLARFDETGTLAGGPWRVSSSWVSGLSMVPVPEGVCLAWVEDRSFEGLGKEVFTAVCGPDGTVLEGPANETCSPGDDVNPVLSRSGERLWLGFQSARDGSSDVYVRRLR